jgi:hypothetical protein
MQRLLGRIESELQDYKAHLKALEFVREVIIHLPEKESDGAPDMLLGIKTPVGHFKLAAEIKNVYPNAALVNSIIARARHFEHQKDRSSGYVALLAQTARIHEERLVKAHVNFVDRAGNLNLRLGRNYQAIILGRRKEGAAGVDSGKVSSRAGVQLLFTLAAHPDAANWPTRQLAQVAGISKSIVARLKHRFVQSQILQPVGRELRLTTPSAIRQQLLIGYSEMLYPRILRGRFRSAIRSTKDFLAHVSTTLADSHTRWALTGGPAADLLQHYYQGEEIPIFLDDWNSEIQRKLRLLPDRVGPIKLLTAFGSLAFWRSVENYTIAHPWLIFVELMMSDDSRAHEAAEELYREFLTGHDRTIGSTNP